MEPSCITLVKELYEEVVKDVITNVQDHFIEEGIDQGVIQELKRTWETKILASKAVSPSYEAQAHKEDNKTVPVQIVLPAEPQGNLKQNVLIVNVPAFALQNNQLYNVLSGPLISATMSLPQPLAASVLQQHMNAAFMSRSHSMVSKTVAQTATTPCTNICHNFGVNRFKGAVESKSTKTQATPSTSGLNQQKLNNYQWKEYKTPEKREVLVDDDRIQHKNKKRKRSSNISE